MVSVMIAILTLPVGTLIVRAGFWVNLAPYLLIFSSKNLRSIPARFRAKRNRSVEPLTELKWQKLFRM